MLIKSAFNKRAGKLFDSQLPKEREPLDSVYVNHFSSPLVVYGSGFSIWEDNKIICLPPTNNNIVYLLSGLCVRHEYRWNDMLQTPMYSTVNNLIGCAQQHARD